MLVALSPVADGDVLSGWLTAFANMAVISSFLGVTLGLFDFVADAAGLDDTRAGRRNTALLTFGPPTVAGILFPNGFIYAIGLAGLCACIWGALIPALAVRAGRRGAYSNQASQFRTPGGSGLVTAVGIYGVLVGVCWCLGSLGFLPGS